jgi:hypothetical protein
LKLLIRLWLAVVMLLSGTATVFVAQPANAQASYRFAYNWTGAWDASKRYLKDDLAQKSGSVWKAKIANINQTPAQGLYWDLFVAAGGPGGINPVLSLAALASTTAMADQARALVNDFGWYRYDAASTVAADGITIVAPLVGGGRWVLEVDGSLQRGSISVKMFGAKGDGIADDTAAINAAIQAVAHAYYSKGTASLLFPPPATGKFYKITGTLDFTEIWNVRVYCPSRYNNQRQTVVNTDTDYALLHWYGPTNTPMIVCDYSFGDTFENISVNGRNIAGVVGFSLSKAATQNSSVKFLTLRECDAKYCDVGIRIGDFGANGPDNAPINIYNSALTGNKSVGLSVNSGNNGVNAYGLVCMGNGNTPALVKGANVRLISGELSLYGYIGAGNGTAGPQDGDIFQDSGGLRVESAWSDVESGMFLNSQGATSASHLSGVRHYAGAMTSGNTPKSIHWQGPQPLVLSSCYLFNSVEVVSGNTGHCIDIGTQFATAGAGFIGDMATTYRGVISIGKNGQNEARVAIGGNPPSTVGQSCPLTVYSGTQDTGQVRIAGSLAVTEKLDAATNSYELLGNCYFDNGTGLYKSVAAGQVWKMRLEKSMLSWLYGNDAAGPAATVTFGNEVFATSAWYNGFSFGTGGQRQAWNSGIAPTTSAWSQGDIVWNSAANGSRFSGYQCTASGTPGTWRPIGSLTNTVSLTFPAVAAGGQQELTISVPGALQFDAVSIGTRFALTAGLMVMGYVSAADVVTVRILNPTAGAITPASDYYRVSVSR